MNNREVFDIIAKQAFSSKQGFFKDAPNSNVKLIVPNAFKRPAGQYTLFEIYNDEAWYLGMFTAIVFNHDDITIDTFFKPSLYKLLLGQNLQMDDLKDNDEAVFNNLMFIYKYVFKGFSVPILTWS